MWCPPRARGRVRTAEFTAVAGPTPGIAVACIGPRVPAGGFARPLPVWSLPDHSPLHAVTLDAFEDGALAARSLGTCNNVRTLIEIVACGQGAAVLPETMVRGELASGALVEVLPRPSRRIHFEAAIRTREREAVVLDLFKRAGQLSIDQGGA